MQSMPCSMDAWRSPMLPLALPQAAHLVPIGTARRRAPAVLSGLPNHRAMWANADGRGAQRAALHKAALRQAAFTAPSLRLPTSPGHAAPPSKLGRLPAGPGIAPRGSVVVPHRLEGHHGLRASEKQDIVLLAAIRDVDFSLLLKPVGTVTPMVHAMRLGPAYKGVEVILVGFCSRFVNDVTDALLTAPKTQALLRLVRSTLRCAIGFAVQHRCTQLLASYMQVPVMSEGQAWIEQSTTLVAKVLTDGHVRQALLLADDVEGQFVRHELCDARATEHIRDYVFNATTDFLMMGCMRAFNDAEHTIGVHGFARDERVTCEFDAQLTHLVRSDKRALAQTPRLVHIAYAIVGIMRDGRIHSATKRWRLGALSQTPPRTTTSPVRLPQRSG